VNGKSYEVRVGNYLGQNFGKVTRIVTEKDEEKILLQELVQEADGAWVERESTLFIAGGGRK
jgi:type IV pilus assembly protein PilP